MAARNDSTAGGITCSVCGGMTSVIDSRRSKVGGARAIRRRRKCDTCPHRFSTYEIEEGALLKQMHELETLLTRFAGLQTLINNFVKGFSK